MMEEASIGIGDEDSDEQCLSEAAARSIRALSVTSHGSDVLSFHRQSPLSKTVKVTFTKHSENGLGMVLGGPPGCVYITSILPNTPMAHARIEKGVLLGDQLISIDNVSLDGLSRAEVASRIHNCGVSLDIEFSRLSCSGAENNAYHNVDITLKKLKNRALESISKSARQQHDNSESSNFQIKMANFRKRRDVYRGLITRLERELRAFKGLSNAFQDLGTLFYDMGIHEQNEVLNNTLIVTGNEYRSLAKVGERLLPSCRPLVNCFDTFVNRIVHDVQLTVDRYEEVCIEYEVYFKKLQDMQLEEENAEVSGYILDRARQGNYLYRWTLQIIDKTLAKREQLHENVMIKFDLLEVKGIREIKIQLNRYLGELDSYYAESYELAQKASEAL